MEDKVVDLEVHNIIIRIPVDTVKLRISAKILGDGDKLMEAVQDLSIHEINKARADFLDNVEGGDDYDARYVLTEKGKEYVKQMLEKE